MKSAVHHPVVSITLVGIKPSTFQSLEERTKDLPQGDVVTAHHHRCFAQHFRHANRTDLPFGCAGNFLHFSHEQFLNHHSKQPACKRIQCEHLENVRRMHSWTSVLRVWWLLTWLVCCLSQKSDLWIRTWCSTLQRRWVNLQRTSQQWQENADTKMTYLELSRLLRPIERLKILLQQLLPCGDFAAQADRANDSMLSVYLQPLLLMYFVVLELCNRWNRRTNICFT